MDFETIYEDVNSKHLSVDEINYGDFPFKVMIEIVDMPLGDDQFSFMYSVNVISISQAGKSGLISGLNCFNADGVTEDNLYETLKQLSKEMGSNYKDFLYTALFDYGIYAQLASGTVGYTEDEPKEQDDGTLELTEEQAYDKALAEAKHEAEVQAGMIFGFAMDRPQNAIGSTGWDLIKGDTLAGLNRYKAAQAG